MKIISFKNGIVEFIVSADFGDVKADIISSARTFPIFFPKKKREIPIVENINDFHKGLKNSFLVEDLEEIRKLLNEELENELPEVR